MQHGRTAQAAMREKKMLGEFGAFLLCRLARNSGQARHGNATQGPAKFERLAAESERHQSGAWGDDVQSELARDAISEIGRAEFRQRKAAGGYDQSGRFNRTARGLEDKAAIRPALHRPHLGAGFDLNAGCMTFLSQHLDNVARAMVAEKLAQFLFVIGNAVLLDQRDESIGPVTGQRRFAEVGVRGEIIFRSRVQVGEIAAAATGDENFTADPFTAFQHEHGASATARGDRRHQSGRAGADHHHVGHGTTEAAAVRLETDRARRGAGHRRRTGRAG